MSMPESEKLTAWEARVSLPLPVALTIYSMAKATEAMLIIDDDSSVPTQMTMSLIGMKKQLEVAQSEVREDEQVPIYEPPEV